MYTRPDVNSEISLFVCLFFQISHGQNLFHLTSHEQNYAHLKKIEGWSSDSTTSLFVCLFLTPQNLLYILWKMQKKKKKKSKKNQNSEFYFGHGRGQNVLISSNLK